MEKKIVVRLHVIFWIITSSVTVFNASIYVEKTLNAPLFIGAFIRIFFHIITFYLFYFIVSPKYFNRKGIIFLVLFDIVYLAVSGLIVTFIFYYPYVYFYNTPDPVNYILKTGMKEYFFYVVSGHTIFSILGALSKILLIGYENKMKQKEIEKQNMSIELAMLRAQINPHFLFNTLNNIKSLIQRLPSKAMSSVEKLTEIMHYMIYESSVEKVPLGNEIKHIRNYLDLEKIRYSDPDFIRFETSGECSNVLIPPLIFMPFVENAFKHGDKLKPSPGVRIRLDVNESGIFFEITNHIRENVGILKKNSGFGLLNIRRRLDLLFGRKYELMINDSNQIFNVKLNIAYI
jgi:two-component system LytT family sensor kinase